MRVVLKYSEAAFESANKAAPLALWPSAPIASSQVPKHPGIVQWLALADSKHCAPLVESCLSQLLPSDSNTTIRRALASPHLRKLVDGLHTETKTDIMCKMAGLPLGCQQVSFMLWGTEDFEEPEAGIRKHWNGSIFPFPLNYSYSMLSGLCAAGDSLGRSLGI